jgi:hypothetical protein
MLIIAEVEDEFQNQLSFDFFVFGTIFITMPCPAYANRMVCIGRRSGS